MYIFAHSGLVEEFFDVLHSVGAIVGGERTGLADWVDMAHVADRGSHCFVLVFDEIVDLFVGWVGARDQVVLVEVGIVGARCVREEVPKPLNLDWFRSSRLCTFFATDLMRIIYYNTLQLIPTHLRPIQLPPPSISLISSKFV